MDTGIEWMLDKLCKERGLKTKTIAELMRLNIETIQRHRRQTRMPKNLRRSVLENYCKLLSCKPGDLLK